jgi:protein required for attachment to host cells
MGTSRHITESQLDRAKAALAMRVKALLGKQVDAKKFKTDPQWRKLDARVRQIAMRLRKVSEVESVNADVVRLREERVARIAAEKAERKVAGGKKAKPEKEKGKGDAKATKKDKAPKKEKAKPPEKAG